VDIGKRLRGLRKARGLSQADIEEGAGLLRCYVSRVENGHTTPSIPILERWAEALEVELSQLFAAGSGKPEAPQVLKKNRIGCSDRKLLRLFSKVPPEFKPLLIALARQMVKGAATRGEADKVCEDRDHLSSHEAPEPDEARRRKAPDLVRCVEKTVKANF
jgi:transcriptional regulator with XRE-family HTH domain